MHPTSIYICAYFGVGRDGVLFVYIDSRCVCILSATEDIILGSLISLYKSVT